MELINSEYNFESGKNKERKLNFKKKTTGNI